MSVRERAHVGVGVRTTRLWQLGLVDGLGAPAMGLVLEEPRLWRWACGYGGPALGGAGEEEKRHGDQHAVHTEGCGGSRGGGSSVGFEI